MHDAIKISMIAAMSDNRVIGRKNTIPWRAKGDFRFFKKQTLGKPVIMGRKTFESLKHAGVQPLPGRPNLVITRDPNYAFAHPNVSVHDSLVAALAHAKDLALESGVDEICIGGGAMIYNDAMPLVDILYLTEIHCHIDDGDTFFPVLSKAEWQETHRDRQDAEKGDTADYSFVTWQRKQG